MEQENIRRAKELGFQGIFTANSNRLTQLISRALKYEVKLVVELFQEATNQQTKNI